MTPAEGGVCLARLDRGEGKAPAAARAVRRAAAAAAGGTYRTYVRTHPGIHPFSGIEKKKFQALSKVKCSLNALALSDKELQAVWMCESVGVRDDCCSDIFGALS